MKTNIYLKEEIINYLKEKKFSSFLPVQEISIPQLLKSKNSFIEAPTGTGKTLSFLIPILEKMDIDNKNIQALIITPTRELAIQINNVLKEMKDFFNEKILSTLAIGGFEFTDQQRKINNGTQIVIGTVDRIFNLRKETKFNFSNLKYFVIDEVDMILNFGSFVEIEEISKDISNKATLAFFSASFPIQTQNMIKKMFNRDIKNIIIQRDKNDELESKFIKSFDGNKLNTLIELLNSDNFNPYFSLIFAKTNDEVELIYKELKKVGIKNIGLFHNGLTQRERTRLLKKINNSELVYLVTTDLMSRGMDFPGVTHIVNYSLPVDLTYYKHRVGRTNRNSVKGNIYDIYADNELKRYEEVFKKNPNIKFTKMKVK